MSYSNAKRNALRWARAEAWRRGIILRRFRQIHGLETDPGPEWYAEDVRDPRLAVLVYHPMGEVREDECRRTSDVVRSWGRHLFGFRFLGGS